MKRVIALLVVAVLGVYLFDGSLGGTSHTSRPAALAADTGPTTNGIVVDGTGLVSGTPDVLRVTLGVSVHRPDVSAALQAANVRQAALVATLRKDGVADKDVQTSQVSIDQFYDRKGRRSGYQVTETVTAKLRNLARAGKVLTDAVAAGGNEAVLQGVSFTLEDNTALLGQARDAAYADAKAKAARYASLSGRTLGDVQLIAETATPQPEKFGYQMSGSVGGPALASVPISPGTTDLSVSVTVRWALR